MPIRIVVAGLLPHDSGKTWFSATLLKAAKDAGMRVAAFKPIGGFSAWFNYEALIASISDNILAGGDARTFSSITGLDVAAINPIAYVATVPDPTRLRPASYLLAFNELPKIIAIWRLGGCPGWPVTHYYSEANIDSSPLIVKKMLRDAARSFKATRGDVAVFLSGLEGGEYVEKLEACRILLETGRDVVLTESFNNASVPYRGFDLCTFDFYVVVAPGQLLLYTGERACRAIEVVGAVRVDKLIPALGKPLLSEPLPPSTGINELAEQLKQSKLLNLLL